MLLTSSECHLIKRTVKSFLLVILLIGAPERIHGNDNEASPNIIIIMTDDQGYGDFGVTGNSLIETPVINQLTHESVRFERFYVSPVCAPTRASLLTGRYFLRTGVNGVTRRHEVMNKEEVTLAEVLKSAGYATGCFGKWHNGSNYPYDPTGQGFDEFWGFTDGIIRNYFNTRLKHNTEKVEMEGFLTDFFTTKAIEFIEKNQQRPFLCYLPYNVPHTPIQVSASLFDKYKQKGVEEYTAGIYAVCETVDHNLDKLVKKLRELDLEEKTVIIFLTDNGPNGDRNNAGMKGKKGSVDEGGIRVPLWVRWKGHFPEDEVITELADHIDIFPTVLDICNVPVPDTLLIDGRSLKPLLLGQDIEWQERHLYSWFNGKGSIRNNRYRLTVNGDAQVSLYDMQADPSQLFNLAREKPRTRDELFKLYQEWQDEMNPSDKNPPVEIGHAEQITIELPTTSSALSENLKYKNHHGWAYDWAINWLSPDDAISWDIKVVNDGTYEVFLQYLVKAGNEGAKVKVTFGDKSLIKKIDSAFVPAPYPNYDNVDRGRPLEMQWQDFSWGKVNLSSGTYQVKVEALEIPGKEAGELYGLKIKNLSL